MGSKWAAAVGECFTRVSLQRETGLTDEQLTAALQRNHIIELVTSDGVRVYPAWQVNEGKLVHGLTDVITALSAASDDAWEHAVWLNADVPGYGRNIDHLVEGLTDEVVIRAQQTSAAWMW